MFQVKIHVIIGTFLLLVQPHFASAQGTKLLNCVDLSPTMLSQCKLSSMELSGPKPFEMDFSVTYKFPCSGPFEFYIETPISEEPNAPKNAIKLEFSTEDKTTAIRGFGPVVSVDRKPNLTKIRPVSKECNLEIISTSFRASDRQKLVWNEELSSLKSLLGSYADNVKAYDALAILEPAFNIYDKLIRNLSADANNKAELLEASKDLLSCADGSNDENCETLINKIVSASTLLGLSDEENAKISKLQKALDAANFTGVFECNPEASEPCVTVDKFLNKYLAAADITKLASVREKLKSVTDAKDKLSSYTKLVKDTQDAIVTLEATMKEYE